MIKVELFSAPGCEACETAGGALREIAQSICDSGVQWRDVNVLEEMDYATQVGVLSLPAIAIDGKLRFPSLPSLEEFRAELARRLSGAHRDGR